MQTIEELEKVVKQISAAGFASIDTETTSMEPHDAELVGISLAVDTKKAWYVPVGHDEQGKNLPLKKTLAVLKPVVESTKIKKM